MRKISVALSDTDRDRLARLAAMTGRSQSEVICDAIAEYEERRMSRAFALLDLGARSDDVRSIADVPDEELLAGFGE